MKVTLAPILLLCGVALIILPPAVFYALWYCTAHFAPVDYRELLVLLISTLGVPLSILAAAIGAVTVLASPVVWLISVLKAK